MNLTALWVGIALLPGACFVYAYVVYPILLRLIGWFRAPEPARGDPEEWPLVSFSVPAYNEATAIRRTIESLLALDYPPDRRQIVIVSDASTDGTDDIVRAYADRGVELCRLSQRSGKTAAENAAIPYLRGPIVVNTDATIRILPASLKPLIRAFQDPSVGVASGRDISVGDVVTGANRGESGYVGYEMWVRSLETRVGSIVGASGCFYAIRRDLHEALVPEALSRDFASALTAREHGLRAVSVNEAVCLVPRTVSLRREFHRKVRTMTRGLETLWFKRHLLNPFRYGWFAWMLFSHKLARWLVFLFVPPALAALAVLAPESGAARFVLGTAAATLMAGTLAVRWPEGRAAPRLLELAGFATVACAAGFLAWIRALRGDLNPIWEPTRRPA
jgi:cellulose synthase/poly-beta-1,6-N-acetylglucosamine synthase-like glycosyltransferase